MNMEIGMENYLPNNTDYFGYLKGGRSGEMIILYAVTFYDEQVFFLSSKNKGKSYKMFQGLKPCH